MMKKILFITFLVILMSCEEKSSTSPQEIGELSAVSIPTASYTNFKLSEEKDPRSYVTHTIIQIVAGDAICNNFSYYGSKKFTNGSPINLRLPQNCSFTIKVWYANEVVAIKEQQSFEANLFYESDIIQISSNELQSNNFDGAHQLARTTHGRESGFEDSVINLVSTGFWSGGGDDSDAWDNDAPDSLFGGNDDDNDKPDNDAPDNGAPDNDEPDTDERLVRGTDLFAQNCAMSGCHPTSAKQNNKRNRSAATISSAIDNNRYPMSGLRGRLSQEDLSDIAYALEN